MTSYNKSESVPCRVLTVVSVSWHYSALLLVVYIVHGVYTKWT